MTTVILLTIVQWMLAALCQSLFYHRKCSHKLYDFTKLFWERCTFVLTGISLGPGYMTAWKYAWMHILHHRFTDKPGDPHPAGEGPIVMLWEMIKFNFAMSQEAWDTLEFGVRVEKYLRHFPQWLVTFTLRTLQEIRAMKPTEDDKKKISTLPRWDEFEQLASSYVVRISWVVVYVLIYQANGIHFSTNPGWLLLLLVNMFMGPLHGFIINYGAHVVGYHNYNATTHPTIGTSTNFPLVANLLTVGEGLHENHHAKSGKANFAHKKGEFDLGYQVLRLAQVLGFIKNLRE